MTTHFYVLRHWRSNVIKILCTGERIEYESNPANPWHVGNGTSSPNQVTCVGCLQQVVERQRHKLKVLEERLRLFREHGTEWIR